MPRPFVSMLLNACFHERFIAQAMGSVRAQDIPAAEREIILVDHGSTDRTPERSGVCKMLVVGFRMLAVSACFEEK